MEYLIFWTLTGELVILPGAPWEVLSIPILHLKMCSPVRENLRCLFLFPWLKLNATMAFLFLNFFESYRIIQNHREPPHFLIPLYFLLALFCCLKKKIFPWKWHYPTRPLSTCQKFAKLPQYLSSNIHI